MKKGREMSALYRKYRPQKFSEVMGQDHVVKVLEGSADLGNISHAYLFAGSRGTGKTSIARIFASSIGCSQNDLYEIDAASNRGIDDVRAIREGVLSLPFESPYKVYIIDEAHMLTKEAWNAFLKTLEEPPQHAVFILATTELEKVPETVVSRCQTFQFKKPTTVMLKELALSVAKGEGFNLAPDGAELVAILGDGSFRDTLGILQKVISFSRDKKITSAEIETVTGAPKGEIVNNFIKALSEKNIESALEAVGAASRENVDMKIFLKLALKKLRYALLLRHTSDKSDIVPDISTEDLKFLKDIAGSESSSISSTTLSKLLYAYEQTSRSFVPELPIELALVELLRNNNSEAKS